MTKLRLLTLLLLCFLLFSGCQKEKTPQPSLSTQSSIIYHTFEDALEQASDIIKAKCLDSINYDEDVLEYEFQVLRSYVGANIGDRIYIYIPEEEIQNSPVYEIGEEYFLLVVKRSDVYHPHPKYLQFASYIYLPCSDLRQSSMYGEPLSSHSQIENLESEEELDQYIVEYLLNHPVENRLVDQGTPYIQSTDIQEILTQSDFVAVVKANEISPISWPAWDRDTWCCTVEEGLKGEMAKDSEIKLVFPKNSVEEGETYVVAVCRVGKIYVFSAPNSMYDLSKLPEIKEYLGVK